MKDLLWFVHSIQVVVSIFRKPVTWFFPNVPILNCVHDAILRKSRRLAVKYNSPDSDRIWLLIGPDARQHKSHDSLLGSLDHSEDACRHVRERLQMQTDQSVYPVTRHGAAGDGRGRQGAPNSSTQYRDQPKDESAVCATESIDVRMRDNPWPSDHHQASFRHRSVCSLEQLPPVSSSCSRLIGPTLFSHPAGRASCSPSTVRSG